MMLSALKIARTLVAAAVILSVPAYAASSLLNNNARSASTPLAAEDDPVVNGFRVVDQPRASRERTVRNGAKSDFVVLQDWSFTTKGTVSPK